MLERDPETLEQALKLASCLEALGYGDLQDNWDDVGRRKDRFAKVAAADETTELTAVMQDLRSELKQNRKELERLRKAGDGRRGGSEFVVGMADNSVRPALYPDQPAEWSVAPGLHAPPLTPPVWQSSPSWSAPPAPPQVTQSDQFVGPPTWTLPPVSSPARYYHRQEQPSAVMYATSPLCNPLTERAQPQAPPRNRSSERCHYCHQRGHWKAECPERQQRQRAQGESVRSGMRTYLNITVAGRSSTC